LADIKNVRGIHHIAIRAGDFDASVRFYTTVLNCTVRHTWSGPDRTIRQVAILKTSDGNGFIEIFDRDDEVASPGRTRKPGEEPVGGALLHFAVTVKDAEQAYRDALSFGCRSCKPPVTLELGQPPVTVKNALVYGPDGEIIEFLEENTF
jgi:catechol 2,3-dioxygenase-like lactoylglutathione lyase family enzyme